MLVVDNFPDSKDARICCSNYNYVRHYDANRLALPTNKKWIIHMRLEVDVTGVLPLM